MWNQPPLSAAGQSNYLPNFTDEHLGQPDANGVRPFTDAGKQYAMNQFQAQPTQSLLGQSAGDMNPQVQQAQQSSAGKGLLGSLGGYLSGGGLSAGGMGAPSSGAGLLGSLLSLAAL